MRRIRAPWLIVAGALLLLAPALAPSAYAGPPRLLLEESFEGRIRAAGGLAGQASGVEPSTHGVLELPEDTSAATFTVRWSSYPSNASILFRVCKDPCWTSEDPTILAQREGTSPLTLVAQAPGFDDLAWEAIAHNGAAMDIRLSGRAEMHGHPDHPGPGERGERVGALSLSSLSTPTRDGSGAAPFWASFLAFALAGVSALASVAKPGTPGVLLGLYHRVERDELLDNRNRARIVQRVREQPGVHMEVLIDELGLARGTIQHHIRLLEDGDLLRAEKINGFRCYFLPGRLTAAQRRAVGALKAQAARRLARVLQREGSATTTELAEALDRALPTVSHHVSKLEAAGVVEVRRVGRCCEISLSEVGREALDGLVDSA